MATVRKYEVVKPETAQAAREHVGNFVGQLATGAITSLEFTIRPTDVDPRFSQGDEDVALKVRTVKIGPDLSLQAVMAQNDQGEAFVIDLSDNSDGRAEVQRVQA